MPAHDDDQSYYTDAGDGTYLPTVHAQGAWSEHEQHLAPVSGLLTHLIERHEPREGLRVARVTLEALGVIHAEPSTVRTRTVRPGRTIELVEAVMSSRGRDVVRASAWRLVRGDTAAIAATEDEPMPGPDGLGDSEVMVKRWGGGYISSIEVRYADARPGRGRAWLRTGVGLVAGQDSSPTARLLGLVDTANGLVVRESPQQWMFPNTDLTIHLHREPVGEWLGLDVSVSFGPDGIGMTAAVLHDVTGPFGRSQQILTIRPQPGV